MAVGLVVGVGFDPSPAEFQELLDRGLINSTGFEYVTLEISVEEATDRDNLRGMFQAACIKQGWELGALGYANLLTFREVTVAGKSAVIVQPEGFEDETWMRGAAEAGDARAMLSLGVMAADEGDRPTAQHWYQRAADAGNAQAMFNLGADAYEHEDSATAIDWWNRAADAGHPKAMFNLGVFADSDGDRAMARSWLQRAADAGDDEARAALAAYPSDTKDPEALEDAKSDPGGMVLGVGFQPTPEQLQALAGDLGLRPGRTYVAHQCTASEAKSEHFLAGAYAAAREQRGWREQTGGLSVDRVNVDGRDFIVVFPSSWLHEAAEAGDASAMLQLGVNAHEDGDRATARSWWQKAAGAGNRKAMFNLGFMAEKDDDGVAASNWYEKAADSGDAQAMTSLAFLADEDGDRASARSWWQKAADASDADNTTWSITAMVKLGAMAKEDGDRASARSWWQRAADAGNESAMYNLGVLASKDGDLDTACDWWTRAADGGHAKAMFNLGVIAQKSGDRNKARSWLQRAADAGDDEAQAALATYPRN